MRWLVPALVAMAALSGAVLFWALGQPFAAGLFLAGLAAMLVAAFVIDRRTVAVSKSDGMAITKPDLSLVAAALSLQKEAAAVTDASGALLSANAAYRDRFGLSTSPLGIANDEDSAEALDAARRIALRDGLGSASGISTVSTPINVDLLKVGAGGGASLLWSFPKASKPNLLKVAAGRIAGTTGNRLAAAGVMAALINEEGILLAGNQPFSDRAVEENHEGPVHFTDLVTTTEEGLLRLKREGEGGPALRGVHVPFDPEKDSGAGTFLLFDATEKASLANSDNVQVLLELLPLGLALVDRDGRFLTMNT
ncbi:MAG: hypothetical protein EX258_02825, partial [Sphingomonadaceae bacterium]